MDYRKYCDLESFLFNDVSNRFRQNGYLGAFDFFCIIIWKANRAKSRIAKKLMKNHGDLESAVNALTSEITRQSTGKDRLHFLWKEKFELPMASAILTVLYPNEFTVYDVRVCDMIGDFHKLKNQQSFDALWDGYQKFKSKVVGVAPKEFSLRDKDHYLWGKSFYTQLESDIATVFARDKARSRKRSGIIGSRDKNNSSEDGNETWQTKVKEKFADNYITDIDEKTLFLKATYFCQWANYMAGLTLSGGDITKEFGPVDVKDCLRNTLIPQYYDALELKNSVLTADVRVKAPHRNPALYPCLDKLSENKPKYIFVGFKEGIKRRTNYLSSITTVASISPSII